MEFNGFKNIYNLKKMNAHLTILILFFITKSTGLEVFAQHILQPPKNDKLYVIAHRGAHIGIPENSLPAYQKAIELGCDFVEIDIRTTRDNHHVSIHNPTIDAYVDGQAGKVRKMTLEELRQLDIGARFDKSYHHTQIPTFEEILDLCQNKIGIYLDLKDADPEALIGKIKTYKMERQIIWYIPASSNKIIMEIKQDCPECLVMPDPGAEQNIEKVMVAYRPKVIASDMTHLSDSFVQNVHDGGALIFVDDSEEESDKLKQEWKKMINWQVDGIQTDHPEDLISYLKNKN